MAAGGMDPALAQKVYVENPRVVMCGGEDPAPSRAGPCARPTAATRSGARRRSSAAATTRRGASWPRPVYDGDELRLNPDGSPFVRMFFLHRDRVDDPRHLGRRRPAGFGQPRRDGRGRHRAAGVRRRRPRHVPGPLPEPRLPHPGAAAARLQQGRRRPRRCQGRARGVRRPCRHEGALHHHGAAPRPARRPAADGRGHGGVPLGAGLPVRGDGRGDRRARRRP